MNHENNEILAIYGCNTLFPNWLPILQNQPHGSPKAAACVNGFYWRLSSIRLWKWTIYTGLQRRRI
jgi:hypothetical protein